MNKKAQGMSLTTIILIVLGLVVLIFLIYGFSTGWANLWDRITQYTGGESNIDAIRSACILACSTNSKQQFCEYKRTVKYGKKIEAWDGKGISEVTQSAGTCHNMTNPTNYPGVNIEGCSDLCA